MERWKVTLLIECIKPYTSLEDFEAEIDAFNDANKGEIQVKDWLDIEKLEIEDEED